VVAAIAVVVEVPVGDLETVGADVVDLETVGVAAVASVTEVVAVGEERREDEVC